jgi:diacylglycerol O-acyltransferase / wax synthase
MGETLSALDGTFLELEDASDGALMHIGSVLVFDPVDEGPAPGLDEVRGWLDERLGGLTRLRQRLSSERTARWAWPHWVEDPRDSVADHLRRAALPAPGGDAELREWIGDFYAHRLDRTRPLWEMVLLEGLEGGRWALAQKLHHCLLDGMSSVGLTDLLLDDEPRHEPAAELPALPSEVGNGGWHSLLPHPPAPLAQATSTGTHAITAALAATLRPYETLARSRLLAELIVTDELRGAPHTSLNVPIGPSRRYAFLRCPLTELRAVGEALGGSMNDAALSLCASGLRELLAERDEPLPRGGLRAMVPVDLRNAADRLLLGNRVGSLFVELPVAEPLATERHRLIVERTRRLKNAGAGEASATFVDLAALAPPLVHASLARLLYGTRLFNVTITNVRGASSSRYALGSRLREIHPIVPLAPEHAVGVAIVSYDGDVVFGINADRESMPDLEVLVAGMRQGLGDLLTAIHQLPNP